MVRAPVFAGSFYPAAAPVLRRQLADFMEPIAAGAAPKALIAPHAGYVYSGPVAASVYARLQAEPYIRRVVLLGPTHRVGFEGLALSQARAFATPLGEVELDAEAARGALTLPWVGYGEWAHAQEHSLEVQLPFLQQVLGGDFKLLPVVVGQSSAEQISRLLDLFWDETETLIVISSDLSHYHDYVTAQRLDRATTDKIEHLAYQGLSGEDACGYQPISGLLHLLQARDLRIRNIDLRNSGDTAGDKRRVVGYGAYVVN